MPLSPTRVRRPRVRSVPPGVVVAIVAIVSPLVGAASGQTGTDPTTFLSPATHIEDRRIDESSGLVWLDGAFYTHNDSGDGPVVYRSTSLDFQDAHMLRVPGARAVDWEDITVLDGDLLIGDIGDNERARSSVTLYRARYRPGPEEGLERIATYPVRYPDAPHDAEALAVVGGKVTIISKERQGDGTNVYVFDTLVDETALPPGGANVPRLVSRLEIDPGDQVTAADYDPGRDLLVVLTYTHILRYPGDRIEGKPAVSTLIAARQCEAVCFRGDSLVITNEQRDVYVLPHFAERAFGSMLPPRGSALRPSPGTQARFSAPDISTAAHRPYTWGNVRVRR